MVRSLFRITLLIAMACLPSACYSKIINDFSQLSKTTVSDICYPKTSAEIQEIVARAKRDGKKISVAGKRHSQGGHAFYADAVVIDTSNFNKILRLDARNKIITVQTGATWEQIQEYINPHKLALKVMQTTQIFSVGGSLSVNAHGRDPKHGPLIETIKAIRILLASGEIVQASRTENHELFSLAIGGYGLFGIILEADIELTDNIVYSKKAQVINVSDYEAFVRKNVINNPDIGLHYGIICLAPYNFFKKMLVVNYSALPWRKRIPKKAYVLEDEQFVKANQKGLNLRRQSYLFNLCSEFGEWPFLILREKLPHTTCRNNAMRHPAKCLKHEATTTTDILQSYFIPTHKFVDFMDYLSTCSHEESLKILYALCRYIPKNSESFLTYTTDNYFEIVLFINQGTSPDEINQAQQWTQRVVDKVLSYNGRYYLPVRLYPSQDQIEKAYPQLQDFFAKKREFDPQELFMNNFYTTYCTAVKNRAL